ncbi:neuromedin U [Candidatus Eisenbacteria bacterium]|uniref:Neuromedin U n=1 Tax=Eiseniibacteriota bacterium TaxID=2212470 RepID=A0ABV6YNY6_UNCEI
MKTLSELTGWKIACMCAILTLGLGAFGAPCHAEDEGEDLAKQAQNPISNLISLPLQNNTSFNIGPYDRTANVLNIQPVVPFYDGSLITRTILPVVYQPDLASESGGSTGLGDLNFTAFYVPKSGGVMVAAGPILTFPTGGEERGSQKWSAGPSLILISTPGPWVLGALWNNIWSYAGDKEACNVNQMLLQYFINYNFPDFYLTSAPIITANWEAEDGQQWTVPFGLGIGKMVKLGKLPTNTTAQYYYNAVTPDYGPDWSLRLQVQFLFPK